MIAFRETFDLGSGEKLLYCVAQKLNELTRNMHAYLNNILLVIRRNLLN